MISVYKIKEKKNPPFLIKLLLFLVILIVLDFLIGSTLKYFYFKQESGLLYRTTYSLDSVRNELLIFGSSTANHHYNPTIFKNRLGTSAYNTGRDASTILYNYAIFQSILKRYKPKIVILDFNVGELKIRQDSYDKLSSLLPYYQDHPEVHSIIELKSPYEKYKLLSKIYPFNSLIFTIAIGTTDFNKSREEVNDKDGYIPLNYIWNKDLAIKDIVDYKLDTNKINALNSFVIDCKKNNILLYIIISPHFAKYNGKDPSVELVHSIAEKADVPFYDYSQDSLFWKHKEYFADQFHLNNTGAAIFSNRVIDTIMQSREYLRIRNKNNLLDYGLSTSSSIIQNETNNQKKIFKRYSSL